MKTDNNYIYPTSPEELSAFYGWDNVEELTENDDDELDWFKTDEPMVESFHVSEMETDYPHKYRIPLPTLSDLRVGDVVRYKDSNGNYQIEELYSHYYKALVLGNMIPKGNNGYLNPIELLVSRNTWVKVKV